MTDERKQAEEILKSKLPKSGDIFPYNEVLDAMEEFASLKVAEMMKENEALRQIIRNLQKTREE